MHLVVTEPFGEFTKGDRITDGVEDVLASHPANVVRVAGEQPEAPTTTKPAKSPAPPADAPADPIA